MPEQNIVELAPEERLKEAVRLAQLGRHAEARSIAIDLATQTMSTAQACSSLGLLLSQLDLMNEASKQYQRAVELAPEQGGSYYNLATAQRALGDLPAARSNFSRAIELNKADFDAWYARSELGGQTGDHNNIAELEALLDAGIDTPQGKVQVLYALARELENTGQAEQSFHCLQQGADLRRQHLNYRVQSDLDTLHQIQDNFSAKLFDRPASGYENREPLFVLGLPRTGSTLVERILGSHSDVHAAGELNNFPRQMMRQVQTVARAQNPAAKALPREQLLALTASLDFRQLGDAYVESTRPGTGHTAHFVDKLPLNFMYAGLIHLALPNARIVHVQRRPMDSCYAIYKTLFRDAYPFSYNLQELGEYYLAYRQLMAHWQQVMPGVIHTVRYEDLVADIESKTGQLLEHCGLPFQQQCLRFHENDSASTTASAAQVRSALYSSSVGTWRQHERQLQPLVDQLTAAGLEIL